MEAVEGKMIDSAEEFIRLRYSENMDEYERAARESAPIHVWIELLGMNADVRFWVAVNKTVPVEVLQILSKDDDVRVRSQVAMKRKITPQILETLSVDSSGSIRMSVARHKNVSTETLQAMKEDESEEIRALVIERLSGRNQD